MSKILKTTLLALSAAAIFVSPAQAGYVDGIKNASLSATSTGDLPTLIFQSDKGGWTLLKSGSKKTVKLHLKAQRKRSLLINSYKIKSSANNQTVTVTQAKNFKLKKLDKSFTHKVRGKELNFFVEQGRKVCEQRGKSNQTVKKKIKPGLLYWVTLEASNPSPIINTYSTETANAKEIPVQIICKPSPFKVKDVDLTVKYEKLPGKCKVKARLRASVKTNKSNKNIEFWLYRKDGHIQKLKAKTNSSGTAYYNKNYTFKEPVNRNYMINMDGTTTKWVPMKVKCSSSSSSGFQHNN
ncbi:MAG: hypothetical protein ABJN40_02080 [Sneathiella sp.]